jgi:Protein of unknown function (DUF1566)
MIHARVRGLQFAPGMLLFLVACENTSVMMAVDTGVDGGTQTMDASPPDASPQPPANCSDADPLPCPPPGYATWPMPNPQSLPLPNPGSFTLTPDTATDRVTGLHWQRAHTAKLDWQTALETCANLTLQGYDDWRLPSRIEIVSMVDYTRQPTVDGQAFENTALDYFWSSSTVSYDTSLAYSVYFGAGLTAYGMKGGASAHVRCVRGGTSGVVPRYTIGTDEVVDRNTGLVWQRQASTEGLSFATANLLCNESKLNGKMNWRLPSTKELQTIVEERFAKPMIDPAVFPNTPNGRYWTSSAAGGAGSTNGVYLEMGDGTTEHAASGEPFFVRCVR